MISQGDVVQIVLDVYVDKDAYRVVTVGVFEPGSKLPDIPDGAARNVVQTWLGVKNHIPSFRLGR